MSNSSYLTLDYYDTFAYHTSFDSYLESLNAPVYNLQDSVSAELPAYFLVSSSDTPHSMYDVYTCGTCGYSGEVSEFSRNSTRLCRSCLIEGFKKNHATRVGRLREGGGKASKDDISEMGDNQDWKCTYCGINLKTTKKHLDHIIPVSRGGSSNIDNLQWLCATCNLTKHAKTHDEYVVTLKEKMAQC